MNISPKQQKGVSFVVWDDLHVYMYSTYYTIEHVSEKWELQY